MVNFIFFFHLIIIITFNVYVFYFVLMCQSEVFSYSFIDQTDITFLHHALGFHASNWNNYFEDFFFLDWFYPGEAVLLNYDEQSFFMLWRNYMYISEYSRVYDLRDLSLFFLEYINFTGLAVSLEEYLNTDLNFPHLVDYVNYLEEFTFDVFDASYFAQVIFFDFPSNLVSFNWAQLLYKFFNVNYLYFTLNFNFLTMVFIFLSFLVFFVVWFYAFCIGISYLEFYIYLLIELLSFVIFLVDNLFYFVVILEVTTVLLLFTYTGNRYRRFRAMSFLFYYTMVSGLFLLFIFLLNDVVVLATEAESSFFFVIMVVGIAIKLPIFPFHLWLPEAHAEATTCGSLILAGVILKMGFYGFVFFVSNHLFFSSLKNFIVIVLLFSSLFLLFAIYVQVDIKKIIAYSSVVHMQIALAVFLMDASYAYEAALLVVINHGLVSVGLFVVASLFIASEGTRDIIKWTYSSNYLSKFFLCFILSNMSFPFTIGFWGELFALYAALSVSFLMIIFFLLNQLIVVVYNLRFYWLVLSVLGPYFRLQGQINYKVTIVLFLLLFFNFILFFLFFSFVN